MPRLVVADVPELSGTRYPAEYAGPCLARAWKPLGALSGLTQFGVNLPDIDMQFLPGCYSGGGGFARKDGTKI